jgi:hypothetical protein
MSTMPSRSPFTTNRLRLSPRLTFAFVAHCIASLVHFTHNAVYIDDYPNLPARLTPAGVYASWIGLTAVGITGLALIRFGLRKPGLSVLVLYTLLGFGGLDHYTVASIRAHTLAMNLTIGLETLTASLLFVAVIAEWSRTSRGA